jgi:SAM-dependent methyltransferase
MTGKKYLDIVRHLERCFETHGDTPQGVDWPNARDALKRHRVMLDLVREPRTGRVSLLDFGCGLSHFYEFLRDHGIDWVDYTGQDISEKFVAASRRKFPELTYYCLDVLDDDGGLPEFDYVVMNGVFTEKVTLSYDEMLRFFKAVVACVFRHARVGVAFNVMSKQVDWERDDLFHLPLDELAWFVTRELSRHFVIRNDYGLYEYTTYVYRQPAPGIAG